MDCAKMDAAFRTEVGLPRPLAFNEPLIETERTGNDRLTHACLEHHGRCSVAEDAGGDYNGPLVQTKFQKIIMNQIIPYRSILFPEPTIRAFPAVAALRSRVALTG